MARTRHQIFAPGKPNETPRARVVRLLNIITYIKDRIRTNPWTSGTVEINPDEYGLTRHEIPVIVQTLKKDGWEAEVLKRPLRIRITAPDRDRDRAWRWLTDYDPWTD